ncbi:MAG: PCMD domain-containing protein [Bacteroidaceae bacterium]|nr:PCMD domain-containing protein [Bacteroidaceae bacterium]
MKKAQYILSALFVTLVMSSCSQNVEIGADEGFLSLDVTSLASTNNPGTRAAAPDDYAPKTLAVEIIDENGKVVNSTDNFAMSEEFQGKIVLPSGQYTIVAHSAKWDGNGSGFDVPYYYGTTTVLVEAKSYKKAKIVCTQANVKLTVNYDKSFTEAFTSAVTTIKPVLGDFASLDFVMGKTTKSGYIPAESFQTILNVTNENGIKHTMECDPIVDVQPRDHFVFNLSVAKSGQLGDGTGPAIKIEVDESTNTYTYTFEVPKKSALTLVTRAANAWSTFAYLNASVTAKTSEFDKAGLVMQWRKTGVEEWSTIENDALTIDNKDNVSAVLKGLQPNTSYEYRLSYVKGDDEVVSDQVSFKTEGQETLYNGGFEHWHQKGAPWYACESGKTYWDSSNPGSTSLGESYNVTTPTENPKRSGSKAARLESKYIVIKFAAASLYTGNFKELVGTKGAKLDWGVPFTSRPTALKGWMQYAPKAIDRAGKGLPAGAPAKGDMDQCGMFIALLSEAIAIDNTDLSTIPDFETDSRVIAYGSLPQSQNVNTGGQWKEVNIPLVYHNLTKKPTHLLVVFSSSKYGDYFHGGTGSTLYLDDFSLEYGDTPAVK